MIAVTFALPTESSLLRAHLKGSHRVSTKAGALIFGEIGTHSIVILHTGVGQKLCQKQVCEFLEHEHPDFLISSGFAGGIRPDLQVGELFLAENFSDPRLLSIAKHALNDRTLRIGKLFTSKSIIDSADEREEIARIHAADAIDMETETIAHVCAERGTPVLALRALTDTACEPLPAPPSVLFDLERQKTNLGALAGHLMARPAAIGRMIRFARQIRRVRKNLTAALTTLLQNDSLGPIKKP